MTAHILHRDAPRTPPETPEAGSRQFGETEAAFLREAFVAALARLDIETASRLRHQLRDGGWLLGSQSPYILRPRPGRPGGM